MEAAPGRRAALTMMGLGIGAGGRAEHPARSLGSRWPSPKFSIFLPQPRAWQGHGVPGPPQQPVKLVAVPRRVGLEGLQGIPCASCLRGPAITDINRAQV